MPTPTDWAPYIIYLTDAAQVATLQATYPNGIKIAPALAASAYGAPLGGQTPGGALTYPATLYNYVYALDLTPYVGVENFVLAQVDGSPANWFWIGQFLYAGTAAAVPPSPIRVGRRRWICGFEIPTLGEGGSGQGQHASRDASRTIDGMGFAYRANANDGRTQPTTPASPHPSVSWERFYLRIRTLGSGGEDNLWFTTSSVEAGPGVLLNITTSGTLRIYNIGNAAYPGTLLAESSALTTKKWYRIDIGIQYTASSSNIAGRLLVYINGVLTLTGTVGVSGGLGTVQTHVSSTIGATAGATSHGAEVDFDDWIGADDLAGVTTTTLTGSGIDLTSGSHVQLLRPTGFGPGHNAAAWTGDWHELLGNPEANSLSTSVVTGNTSGAVLQVATDYALTQIGCVAIAASFWPVVASGAGTVSLGVSINGGPATLSTYAIFATTWGSSLYSIATPVTLPLTAINSVALQFNKAADATTVSAQALLGSAEFMGVFGQEDVATVLAQLPATGIHNSPYPGTGPTVSTPPPIGTVAVASGVYTGNNLGQDILAKVKAHWWFVRPLSGGTTGVWWYSSMEAAHGYLATGFIANRMPQARLLAGTPALSAAGPDGQANATGVPYQWIAVSDDAFRFMLNGAFAHKSTLASAVNSLIDSAFTPDAAFLFMEAFSGTTTQHYYKGIGHTANSASPLDATVNNAIAAVGAGSITSLTAIHTDTPQTAFSAWRRSDGSGSAQWLDTVTYTGDGTGARNIAVSINGTRPLFAMVTPHNGASFARDPSHTGTNSINLGTAGNSTTAITGGAANQVQVGATLNANGVVYDVFVIGGVTTAGNGGWSANPADAFGNPIAVYPISPAPRTGGPYGPSPTPPSPTPTGCISLGTAITELATRLGDSGLVHWTSSELTLYLIEALRVYNAMTQTARDLGTFSTVAATTFYDLPTQIPTQRGYTVKDQDLVTLLEYHLLEPPTPTAWSGTGMFTLAGLTQALQRRLNRFLMDTGLTITRELGAVTPDANGRVALSTDVIEVRRAAWTGSGVTTPLVRDDEWALDAYARTWRTATAGAPTAYSVGVTPPLTVQLAAPPNGAGTLDVLAITNGPTLAPATGVLLDIPDDFAWVVKFGALADLLSAAGPAQDLPRAALARSLWDYGVKAAQAWGVVLDATVAGSVAKIGAVNDLDRYARTWQTATTGPTRLVVCGPNLVAITPLPTGVQTVALNVVRNQPVPITNGVPDPTACYFEGGIALTAALLDYAQFLALYKEGPNQAQQAQALLQSFLNACGVSVELDVAQTPDRGALFGQSRQDERQAPRRTPPAPGSV